MFSEVQTARPGSARRALRAGLLTACLTALGACATTGATGTRLAEVTPDPAKAAQVALHAMDRYDQGLMKEADGYARVALALDADNPDARRVAGDIALAQGRLSEAITHYGRLTTQDARRDGRLGLALMRDGQADAAKPYLMSAVASDPTLWREAVALASLELDAGDATKAKGILGLAERVGGNAVIIAELKGRTQLALGDHAGALASFRAAQAGSDGRVGAGQPYRTALAQSGQLDAALDGADTATQAMIYRDMAQSALDRRDKPTAVAMLKRARQVSPRHDAKTEALMAQALKMDG